MNWRKLNPKKKPTHPVVLARKIEPSKVTEIMKYLRQQFPFMEPKDELDLIVSVAHSELSQKEFALWNDILQALIEEDANV